MCQLAIFFWPSQTLLSRLNCARYFASLDVTYYCFNFPIDTHALVYFQEEQLSSIVPIKHVEKKEDLCAGENCYVIWSDNKKYFGTLIFSGIDLLCGVSGV